MATADGQVSSDGDLPDIGDHELSTEIREFVGEMQHSRESWDRLVSAIDRDRRNRNRWFAGIAVALAVIFVGVGVLLARQAVSAERSQTIKDLTTVVYDCTTPGGTCYEREVQRQRQRDAYNLALSLAVADCTRTTANNAQLRTCVDRQLTGWGVTLPSGTNN